MKAAAKEKSHKSPLLEGQLFKEKESLVFWSSIIFNIFFLFAPPFSYKTGPGLFNGYIEAFEGRIYGAIEYQLYTLKQQTVKMHDVLLLGTQHFPWDTPIVDPNPQKSRESFYDRLFSLDVQLVEQAVKDNDKAAQDKYSSEAKQVYALVQVKTKHLLTLPKGQSQGSDFKVTEIMQAAMDKINSYDKND